MHFPAIWCIFYPKIILDNVIIMMLLFVYLYSVDERGGVRPPRPPPPEPRLAPAQLVGANFKKWRILIRGPIFFSCQFSPQGRMQDLPNGRGAPMQALAPGRWRPSLRHCLTIDLNWELRPYIRNFPFT